MKQTIEIEVPDGKVAVWENGTLKLIDGEPTMPKTWEEFCEVHPLQPTDTIINSNCSLCPCCLRIGELRRENEDRNYLPTREAAEAHLALMQLHQLRDYYRQGWKPDWFQIEAEYSIIQVGYELTINPSVNFNSFLSFQTEEIAEEFLNNFRDLIEQAGDLI